MYRDGLDSQYKLFISLSGLSRVLYRRHVGFLQSAKKGKSCLSVLHVITVWNKHGECGHLHLSAIYSRFETRYSAFYDAQEGI